jgi:hypothetical protein
VLERNPEAMNPDPQPGFVWLELPGKILYARELDLLPCVLVLALFGCGGGSGGGPTGLTEGTLEVIAFTTGSSPDPDGYTLTVDNGAPQPLPSNGADTVGMLACPQSPCTS